MSYLLILAIAVYLISCQGFYKYAHEVVSSEVMNDELTNGTKIFVAILSVVWPLVIFCICLEKAIMRKENM